MRTSNSNIDKIRKGPKWDPSVYRDTLFGWVSVMFHMEPFFIKFIFLYSTQYYLEPVILVFINKLRNILELYTGTSKKLTKIFDKVKYVLILGKIKYFLI